MEYQHQAITKTKFRSPLHSQLCSLVSRGFKKKKKKLQWVGSSHFLSTPAPLCLPWCQMRSAQVWTRDKQSGKLWKRCRGLLSRWDLSQEVGKVMHPETSWEHSRSYSFPDGQVFFLKLIKGAVRMKKSLLWKKHGCNLALIVHFSQ